MMLRWMKGGVAALCLGIASAAAADGEWLEQRCAHCHALSPPADASVGRLWERNGPDLYYAGSKFNREWLERWLQAPERIRPAGVLYTRSVRAGEAEDVIDEATLEPHPVLSPDDARAAAEALMALTGPEGLIDTGAFKNAKVSASMGAMFFGKLRGCSACHMSQPDSGGRSGPELYSAVERLQPDYIYSFIKDPQRIDPKVWMPKLELSEQDLQRLTGYILSLGEAGSQP